MSKKEGYTSLLQCRITPEAEELIRSKMRRKGDMGRLVNAAVMACYGPQLEAKPQPQT